MLKWMFGLFGVGVLLSGAVFFSALCDRAQAASLSEEAMEQLVGGADVRKALFQSGTIDPDSLACAEGEFPTGGCSATDWEKRKYNKCVACNPGQQSYSPTSKYWYRRLNECYTTSEGCKRRVSKQSTTTVCHDTAGTCL